MDASEPPARKISASPNLMMRHDSPMALFAVAQAVTIHILGPCRLNSIDMRPLAMLLSNIGIVNGEFRDGPLVSRIVNWSWSVFSPPIPLLTRTPKRSRCFRFATSIPLSSRAIFDAPIASCENRSVRRMSFGFLKNSFGSKSRTCPPILQSYAAVSNASMV